MGSAAADDGSPRRQPGDPGPVRALDPEEFTRLVGATTAIYGLAMHRSPSVVASRREVFALHATYPGMLAVAVDGPEGLVGFGYGYLGEPGQWWHDTVSAGLGPRSGEWIAGSFELAELHVLPAHHGRGLGRALLTELLRRTPADRVVLSTPDRETPARGLYRATGFTDLLTGFYFPGSGEAYAVMGLDRRPPAGSGG